MPYAHTDHPADPNQFTPGTRYYFENFDDDDTDCEAGRGFYLTNNIGVECYCIERTCSYTEGCGDWIITEDDETAKPHTVRLTIRVPLDRVSAVAEEFEVVGTP